MVEVCPLLSPETVKFKGFAEVAERPVMVSWLDPPAEMEVELKVHVIPLLHARTMEFSRRVLGPWAEMVKVVLVVPMGITLDRALEESEKTGVPVPLRVRPVFPFTASDATETLPATVPEPVGEKLTLTLQL